MQLHSPHTHSLIDHMDSEVFSNDEELSVYILRNFRGMLEKPVTLEETVSPFITYTVEPPNNRHVGDECFVHYSEVVPSLEVLICIQLLAGGTQFVHCREVVRSSECPLSEVPLYTHIQYEHESHNVVILCIQGIQLRARLLKVYCNIDIPLQPPEVYTVYNSMDYITPTVHL